MSTPCIPLPPRLLRSFVSANVVNQDRQDESADSSFTRLLYYLFGSEFEITGVYRIDTSRESNNFMVYMRGGREPHPLHRGKITLQLPPQLQARGGRHPDAQIVPPASQGTPTRRDQRIRNSAGLLRVRLRLRSLLTLLAGATSLVTSSSAAIPAGVIVFVTGSKALIPTSRGTLMYLRSLGVCVLPPEVVLGIVWRIYLYKEDGAVVRPE